MAELSVHSLMHWLDQCPTPFHVVERAGTVLNSAGYSATNSLTKDLPIKGYLSLDGALVAWHMGTPSGSLRIIGAHTD
jgi:aspartyl aminopeptidase